MIEIIKDLLEKVKASFEFIVKKPMQGFVLNIAIAFVSRLAEFQSKFKFFAKQMFISTADRDYLLLLADNILELRPSASSRGLVIFYGNRGARIPIHTVIKNNEIEYKTLDEGEDKRIIKEVINDYNVIIDEEGASVTLTEDTDRYFASCEGFVNDIQKDITVSKHLDLTRFSFSADGLTNGELIQIKINQSKPIAIEALESGAKGNNPQFNDILRTKITLNGINQDLRVISLSGGRDFEDTEEFRARFQRFKANPKAPFNKNDIKAIIQDSMPSIKHLWIKGGGEGDVEEGSVKILALNDNFELTSNSDGENGEIEKIKELISTILPAQVLESRIIIEKPIIRLQKVKISALEPSGWLQLEYEIEKNIRAMFNRDLFEKGISNREIDCAIFGSRAGIIKVESFTLEEGSFEPEANTFTKFDGFEIGV